MSSIYGTDLCRACLTPTKSKRCLADSVIVNGFIIKISDVFEVFSTLKVPNANSERFPTKLCKPCFIFLYEVGKFGKTVHRTDAHLKTLQNLNENITVNPPANSNNINQLYLTSLSKRSFKKRKKVPISENDKNTLPPEHPKQLKILPKLQIQSVVPVNSSFIFGKTSDSDQKVKDVQHSFTVPISNVVTVQADFKASKDDLKKQVAFESINIDLESAVNCSNCDKKFINKSVLDDHIKSCHKATQPATVIGTEITQEHIKDKNSLQKVEDLQCEICRLVFKDHLEFSLHCGDCSVDDVSLSNQSKSPGGRVMCELCGKSYKNKTYLSIHTVKQHGDNVCPWCNMCYKSGKSLTEHVSSHTEDGMYVCVLCMEKFESLKLLKCHTNSAHKENMDSYFCGECGPESECYPTFEAIQQHLSEHPSDKSTAPEPKKEAPATAVVNNLNEPGTKYYTLVQGADGEDEYLEIQSEQVLHYLGGGAIEVQTNISTAELKQEDTPAVESRLNEEQASSEDAAAKTSDDDKRSYDCTMCSVKLNHFDNLKTHMALKHQMDLIKYTPAKKSDDTENRSYDCSMCDDGKFNQFYSLKRHMSLVHQIKLIKYEDSAKNSNLTAAHRRYKCSICGKSIKRKFNLERHMAVRHSMQTLRCRVCNESFSSPVMLAEHKLIHSASELQLRQCQRRELTIKAIVPGTDRKQQRVYQREELTIKALLSSTNQEKDCSKQLNNAKKKASGHNLPASDLERISSYMCWPSRVCKICDQKFTKWVDLLNHTKIEHGKVQADVVRLERNNCQLCGRKFMSRNAHNAHMWTMHVKMRFVRCQECGRRFFTRCSLLQHMRAKHSTVKSFVCQECGQSFKLKETLRKHVLATHRKQRDYLCSICGRTFLQSSHVTDHMWKHTGVKPYKCRYCPSAFTSVSSKKRHVFKMHAEEERITQIEEEKKYESFKGVSFEALVDSVIFGKNIEGEPPESLVQDELISFDDDIFVKMDQVEIASEIEIPLENEE